MKDEGGAGQHRGRSMQSDSPGCQALVVLPTQLISDNVLKLHKPGGFWGLITSQALLKGDTDWTPGSVL